MNDSARDTKKARAEVENLIDEVVLTIENGVTHADGSPGFEPGEAERLRASLVDYADSILTAVRNAARGTPAGDDEVGIPESIDAVVETIRRGVIGPAEGADFGRAQEEELSSGFHEFARAIVTAAGKGHGRRSTIDTRVAELVRTIRSGLFHVYGRASYAAITGDQLEAYLETFADAVLTVVEKAQPTGSAPTAAH